METPVRSSVRSAGPWVFAILVVAATFRLQGIDWDDGQHLHPDERFLTMVGTSLSLPHSLGEYFDTARSPLNPGNHGYKFFVYGTLPLFLVRAIGESLGITDYGRIHFIGRILSALFDLGTVWLTYVMAARIAGRRAGILSCALAACSVTSIQNAHFFTVDSAAAFFSTAALTALLGFAQSGTVAWQVAFAASFGAALGCRINLALLGLVYPISFLHAWKARAQGFRHLCIGAVAAGIVCAAVFRIVQPYAFAGPGFLGLTFARDFVSSLQQIRAFATGEADYPPSVQWIGRLPIGFAGKNLLVWGLGPAWGFAALIGIVWCASRRGVATGENASLGRIAIAWALLLFGYHAWQFAATGRYFLPIVPVLAVFAAWPLAADRRTSRRVLAGVVVCLTAGWALAFTSIYRRPMTRVEASRWIYDHVPAGSTLATEHWDDGLPLALHDAPRVPYHTVELHLYDEDSDAKRRTLVDQLAAVDYVVLSSNRLYRSIPREPWRYPLTRRYYELLFAGDLGFRLERSFTSYPRLGPLEIPDDEAEEAFTVYDHPHVLIFRKTDAFSRERAERLLGAVSLLDIVRVPPRAASRLYRRVRPTDVPLPESSEVRTAVVAGAPSSFAALVRWVLTFEIVGAALFALLSETTGSLPDRGFGLAKLLAWLAPGYGAWLLCSVGLAANTPAMVRGVGAAIVTAGAAAAWRRRRQWAHDWRASRREVAIVEAVFLFVSGAFLLARAFNPAIHWGEKPMDFAFLNSLLRSRTMPPADPWFSGGVLNYFYFGHALAAFFARLAGVSPGYAFNLAIATIAGMLAVAAYSFGRRLSGSEAGGLFAAGGVTLLGNLDGVRLLLASPYRPLNFDYFWATSRVIRDTINEFPGWNLLFADLHAHVLAQPYEVALLYLGLLWTREPDRPSPPRWLVAGLVGWITGAVAVTSAWSVPTIVVVQLAFLVTAWRSGPDRCRAPAALGALGWGLVVLTLSRVLYWPFWAHYRAPLSQALGWETSRAPLADVVTIFGVFLLALLPPLLLGGFAPAPRRRLWLLAVALAVAVASLRSASAAMFAALGLLGALAWWRAGRDELRIAGMLAAISGAIGVGTELLFVWDRMNTVFKYYLEIWLLLGCAVGGALPFAWRAAWRGRIAWRAAMAAAVAAAAFTTVSGAIGLIRSPFVPSAVPTLDGMSYLRLLRPDELAAYRWLNRAVSGVPVVLEAHGDPYGDFSRVSMNTGLPTVLGWEYHLFQQAHSWNEIAERREDVRTLYSTTDGEVAARLMRKYHVDLVFVGTVERRTYPAAGLAKFSRWPLTQPAFERGGVAVYATPGALHAAKDWVEEVRPRAPSGSAPPLGLFLEPRDLARAPDGTLYVADFGNRRVQHVAGDLHSLGGFGSLGDSPGQFRDPCGIAVNAADGALYVADTWNHRVQKLSPQGEPLAQWTADFYGPRGIAVDRDGALYVADTGNNRVLRMSADGVVERVWGARDSDLLKAPVGIAVGRSGEVYVADVGHHRVVVLSPSGALLRSWPVGGWTPSALQEPYLDVGPDGVVWVTDPSGDRVLLFDGGGRPLGAAHGGPLAMPVGIAVLDADHAAVANARSHSLAIVSRTANTAVVPER